MLSLFNLEEAFVYIFYFKNFVSWASRRPCVPSPQLLTETKIYLCPKWIMICHWPVAAENDFKAIVLFAWNSCLTNCQLLLWFLVSFVTISRIFRHWYFPRCYCVMITIFLCCCKRSNLTLWLEHAYSEIHVQGLGILFCFFNFNLNSF